MPELRRFLGIIIAMYYRDHPPPHFHAIYGEFEITVEIVSGIVNGTIAGSAFEPHPGVACASLNRAVGGLGTCTKSPTAA